MKHFRKLLFVFVALCLVTSVTAQGKVMKAFTADLKALAKVNQGEDLLKAQKEHFDSFVRFLLFEIPTTTAL